MYAEVAPPAAVADAVACLWMRTTDAADKPALVLPDGCFDLIWRPGDNVMLAAPDTVASSVPAAAGAIWVGLRFRPGVGKSVLGVPMDELLNERPTVTDVLAERSSGDSERASRELLARAAQATTASEASDLLTRLGALLTGRATIDREAAAAGRLLADPRRTVAGVALELAVPERSLNRRMREQVGYGPKMLQRVLRLQRFLSLADAALADASRVDASRVDPSRLDPSRLDPGSARRNRIPLADLAAFAGYADQPHLARDAAALTGRTPSALLAAR
jgi:AraC-like DNA-binding protein